MISEKYRLLPLWNKTRQNNWINTENNHTHFIEWTARMRAKQYGNSIGIVLLVHRALYFRSIVYNNDRNDIPLEFDGLRLVAYCQYVSFKWWFFDVIDQTSQNTNDFVTCNVFTLQLINMIGHSFVLLLKKSLPKWNMETITRCWITIIMRQYKRFVMTGKWISFGVNIFWCTYSRIKIYTQRELCK